MIKTTPTQRGFARGEFEDRYGRKCSIQKSSLATEDAIWLGCDEGIHYDAAGLVLKEPVRCSARMHLDQELAKELIVMLQHFVDTGDLP
jgi:hypothetical protein